MADINEASRGLVEGLKDQVVEVFRGSHSLLAKCLRRILNGPCLAAIGVWHREKGDACWVPGLLPG